MTQTAGGLTGDTGGFAPLVIGASGIVGRRVLQLGGRHAVGTYHARAFPAGLRFNAQRDRLGRLPGPPEQGGVVLRLHHAPGAAAGEARALDDEKALLRPHAAVAHATAFATWRSLVREQGLSEGEAVDLMVCMVCCAASCGTIAEASDS